MEKKALAGRSKIGTADPGTGAAARTRRSGFSLLTALLVITFGVLLSACRTPAPPTGDSPPQETATTVSVLPTSTSVPTATETALPPAVFLVLPPGVDPGLAESLEADLETLASHSGYRFQAFGQLTSADLTPDVKIVVVIAPFPDLAGMVASTPDTHFLGIGFTDLQASANLSLIGPEGFRPDQQGFVAGYTAAVITPDWRVGAISTGDTAAGRSALQGFLNGARYFCGLCRPVFPPYLVYPASAEISSDAGPEAWRAAADKLLASAVETVYIYPDADSEGLQQYLAEAGVQIIGGTEPAEGFANAWIGAVRISLSETLEAVWPTMVTNDPGESHPLLFRLETGQSSQISPGRVGLVEKLAYQLQSGFVDTGIDPGTAERR